ncbi:unnamed protein product [Musa acuminata subsp. burmannicoides]
MPCRYGDGERLSAEDEKEVIEKLLTYHPHSEDKIGCGLDSIMVTYNLFMNVAYVLSLFILTFTTIVPTISTNMIFFFLCSYCFRSISIFFVKVDRHPQFGNSRCLFVVRTDGGWIDFSYQKCLRAYVKRKYPSHAEKFIREHFKRS